MSLGWALAQCDWCSLEEGNLDMQTHRETAMWRHTGTQTYRPGAMRRWERKLQWCCHKPGSLKLQKLRQGRILFIESLEGECPWQHFNFGLGASRTERTHLCCLNHPVCGALLGSHREWTPYPAELLPFLFFPSQPSCQLAGWHHPTEMALTEVFRDLPGGAGLVDFGARLPGFKSRLYSLLAVIT